MNLPLTKLKNYFFCSEEENNIIQNEIAQANSQRIFYATVTGAVVTFFNLLLITFISHTKTEIEEIWKTGVLYSNSLLLIVFIFLSFFSYFAFPRNGVLNRKKNIILIIILNIIFLVFSVMGPVISTIDQLVTTAITPYVVTSIVMSFVYIIPPRMFYPYFLSSFIFFYFIIAIVQKNSDVLLSNRVNIVSITGISIIISSILWRKNLKLFKSQRIIKSQKIELEKQYIKTLEYSKELKDLNKTKDRLFSIISHDLRGPLGNMSEAIDFMLRSLDDDKETMVKMLHLLKDSSVSSFLLLDNLLHWSRSQKGELTYKPAKYKIQHILFEVIKIYKLAATKKNIEIKNHVDPEAIAFFDKNIIHTVIRNLVSNSLKFSLSGGTIILSGDYKEKYFIFSVKDFGIGMDKELIQKILFSNEVNSSFGTSSEKGHGLGLLLCKELLKRHDSQLNIESEIGKGTTFSFNLPLDSEEELNPIEKLKTPSQTRNY